MQALLQLPGLENLDTASSSDVADALLAKLGVDDDKAKAGVDDEPAKMQEIKQKAFPARLHCACKP
eukprot:6864139-Alexandrium_andersonii.AAC.1